MEEWPCLIHTKQSKESSEFLNPHTHKKNLHGGNRLKTVSVERWQSSHYCVSVTAEHWPGNHCSIRELTWSVMKAMAEKSLISDWQMILMPPLFFLFQQISDDSTLQTDTNRCHSLNSPEVPPVFDSAWSMDEGKQFSSLFLFSFRSVIHLASLKTKSYYPWWVTEWFSCCTGRLIINLVTVTCIFWLNGLHLWGMTDRGFICIYKGIIVILPTHMNLNAVSF